MVHHPTLDLDAEQAAARHYQDARLKHSCLNVVDVIIKLLLNLADRSNRSSTSILIKTIKLIGCRLISRIRAFKASHFYSRREHRAA